MPDPRSPRDDPRAGAPGHPAPLTRREAREAAARTAAAEAAHRLRPGGTDQPVAGDAEPAEAEPAAVGPEVAWDHWQAPPTAPLIMPAPAAADARPMPPVAGRTSAGAQPHPHGALEQLFTGTLTTDAVGAKPPEKSRTQRRRRRWIALVVVLALVGAAGGGTWYVWSNYQDKVRALFGWTEPADYAPGLAHGEALVTIASGDTGATVSRSLAAAGVTKTATVFYDMLISSRQSPTFYPGVYKLQKEMTAKAALKALEDPASKMHNAALIREGVTEDQILQILSQTLQMPLADLQAAVKDPAAYGVHARSLEGWLFPALYTFPPGATATQVVKTMVDRTVQALDADGVPVAQRQRILTIASIIQREARSTQDFYKVSRVIENRLDPANDQTHGKLQMDSTAQYGYGELHRGTASSTAAALKDDNPWNTYVHTGLPVGPISNPGDVAIKAALAPAPGPWLYFVTVNLDTGETVFSTTYAEQQKAVAQMRTWCTAHPDSGC